jgi:L-alanine-DL-glutamate epimerase-like enolase superfamily enzyme
MPKIVRVEVTEFSYPVADLGVDAEGFARVYAPGATTAMTNWIIAIDTEDGARGEYAAQMAGKKINLAQVLRLAPNLLGRDANHRELIYDDFKRALQAVAHVGVGPIDICLWDLLGKRLNTPVSTLLGGYRTRLPVYASAMHGDRNGGLSDPERVLAFAEQCAALGFRGFKFRGWSDGDAKETIATVRALGRAFGGKLDLMVDPGGDLRTFADALRVGRACDDMAFFWYEDPLRDCGTSQAVHRKLRQMIRTPLLITEHVRGLEPKADWIVAEATDFVRADPEFDLGITGAMKIAHLCEAFGLDVELHGCGPAQRACMSAIRNTNYYELGLVGPKIGNFISPPVYACGYSDGLDAVEPGGYVPVPAGPGLGVVYDWEFIRKNTTAVHRFSKQDKKETTVCEPAACSN